MRDEVADEDEEHEQQDEERAEAQESGGVEVLVCLEALFQGRLGRGGEECDGKVACGRGGGGGDDYSREGGFFGCEWEGEVYH